MTWDTHSSVVFDGTRFRYMILFYRRDICMRAAASFEGNLLSFAAKFNRESSCFMLRLNNEWCLRGQTNSKHEAQVSRHWIAEEIFVNIRRNSSEILKRMERARRRRKSIKINNSIMTFSRLIRAFNEDGGLLVSSSNWMSRQSHGEMMENEMKSWSFYFSPLLLRSFPPLAPSSAPAQSFMPKSSI